MARSHSAHAVAILLAGTAVLSVAGGCVRPAAQRPGVPVQVPASESSSSVSVTATYSADDLFVALTVPRVGSTEVTAPVSLTLTNRSDSVSVVQPFLWKIKRSGPCLCSGSIYAPAWRDREKAKVDLLPGESLELTYAVRPPSPGACLISPSVDTSRERRGLVSTPVTVTVPHGDPPDKRTESATRALD